MYCILLFAVGRFLFFVSSFAQVLTVHGALLHTIACLKHLCSMSTNSTPSKVFTYNLRHVNHVHLVQHFVHLTL